MQHNRRKYMMLDISCEQARSFLATYHFTQTDLPGVFARLGTVQYDPLNPAGRNADLVLQARVPGYRVDDWQHAAYNERLIYDAWDKQACLVLTDDWPMRARIRELHRPYHDREVLQAEPGTVETMLAAIDVRGALSSLELEDGVSYANGDWNGSTRAKRVLRALWACGVLLTHHRKHGRHYYDRPERVIPERYYQLPPLLDEDAYHRWIMARRFQAVGLLRPNAEAAIWSACGTGEQRKRAIAQLVEEGTLTSVRVGEKRWQYYMPTSALPLLNAELPTPRVIFLGPLDSMLWDRKGVLQLFDFDYTWEVYKPAHLRRWGYYVLPVFYGDRFIARLDSRLEGKTWTINRWWWEADIVPDAELLNALREAIGQFLWYLDADAVHIADEAGLPEECGYMRGVCS